jgi:hypothetical protein
MFNALFNTTNRRKMPKQKRRITRKHRPIKKMNCSPIVSGQTVDETTCYTDKILLQIRNAYNQKHTNNNEKITATNPAEVLVQLRLKLSGQCDKEDCWLKLLTPPQQKVMDEMVFAPDKPHEWKKNPTEWLSNHDILGVLQQYEKSNPEFKFIGPTPIDFDTTPKYGDGNCVWEELCHFSLKSYIQQKIRKIGIIFNLDKHYESGSHWVSLFIDIDNSFLFYFDSASNETPPEITQFVKRVQQQSAEIAPHHKKYKYYENYPKNHQKSNTECGMYSLFFIITMLNLNRSVRNKIQLFKRGKIPDKEMMRLRDVYFNG